MTTTETLVIPGNASTDAYRAALEEMERRNACPLCIDEFTRTGADRLLRQFGGWVLSETSKPYENTEQQTEGVVGHMLIFPERHLVGPDEMTPEDLASMWEMFRIARNDFGAATGGLGLRYSSNGKHSHSGLSITHFHAHVMVPHIDPESGRVPVDEKGQLKQVMFDIG